MILTPGGAFPVSDYFKQLEKAPQQMQIEEKKTDQALHESADAPAEKTEQEAIEEIMRNKVIPELGAFGWMGKFLEFNAKVKQNQDNQAEKTKKN